MTGGTHNVFMQQLRLIVVLAVGLLLLGLLFNRKHNPSADEAAPPRIARIVLAQDQVTAARIDLAHFRLRVVDRNRDQRGATAYVEEVCPEQGAAINASYFAADRTPLGLLIVDGTRYYRRMRNSGWPGKWGYFVLRGGKPSILVDTAPAPNDAGIVLQCGPRLVIAGAIPKFKNRLQARRSAVGIDSDGRILFAVANTRLTCDAWAAILRDRLHCVDALNLDGGPSTQLMLRGETDTIVPGGWGVPVFLVAEPKE